MMTRQYRLETGPLCFSAFSRDWTRMNAHGCSAGYMKQRGFLFCDERKIIWGEDKKPYSNEKFSLCLFQLNCFKPCHIFLWPGIAVEMLFKAFQVLLNLFRSLSQD